MTNRATFKGKVQTVLGFIEPAKMGITLTHEHLFIDMRSFFIELSDNRGKRMGQQPISFKNLSWIRSHRHSNLDNLTPFDLETATKEVLLFKRSGGQTIVEQTPINMGRDPAKLMQVAQATGVNIIMGTSYYREMMATWSTDNGGGWAVGKLGAYPEKLGSATEESIAEEFTRDITIGIGDTGIRAGFIGEIGCTWPLTKNEQKVLMAAVIAQKRTGALITVHPGFHEDSPVELLELLCKAGADATRIVICHLSLAVNNHSTRLKLAKAGCYVEWDLFGFDGVYPRPPTPVDLPSDQGRVRQIIQLIDAGFLSRILISRDICSKISLTRYGGQGYSHILDNVVPIMQQKGMTTEQIHTILVENPKRAFAFV